MSRGHESVCNSHVICLLSDAPDLEAALVGQRRAAGLCSKKNRRDLESVKYPKLIFAQFRHSSLPACYIWCCQPVVQVLYSLTALAGRTAAQSFQRSLACAWIAEPSLFFRRSPGWSLQAHCLSAAVGSVGSSTMMLKSTPVAKGLSSRAGAQPARPTVAARAAKDGDKVSGRRTRFPGCDGVVMGS